jgi:hypothetical protein
MFYVFRQTLSLLKYSEGVTTGWPSKSEQHQFISKDIVALELYYRIINVISMGDTIV